MTFLTVNYCKGISTIIQLQNNANGVLRIYHLSESSVIGALKEIKFQFMYVNFVYNKNVNRIFHVIKNSNEISKVCEIETANFLFFCPQIIQIQTDFMILNSMTSYSLVESYQKQKTRVVVWEQKTHSSVFLLLYKSKLGFLFPFWYIDQLNTFNNIFIYFMRQQ